MKRNLQFNTPPVRGAATAGERVVTDRAVRRNRFAPVLFPLVIAPRERRKLVAREACVTDDGATRASMAGSAPFRSGPVQAFPAIRLGHITGPVSSQTAARILWTRRIGAAYD